MVLYIISSMIGSTIPCNAVVAREITVRCSKVEIPAFLAFLARTDRLVWPGRAVTRQHLCVTRADTVALVTGSARLTHWSIVRG